MKKIYIILTHTGTTLSKIIKTYTKDEFSHVSIALDEKLKKMYSFGRLNPYNPLIGGFVHEGIFHGTFNRFKNTEAEIYSLQIETEQYKAIEKIIRTIKNYRKLYRFNMLGLIAVAFHMRIRFRHSFYCAEFVKYVLDNAKVKSNLPEIIRPEDFRRLENLELEYKGKLRNYSIAKHKLLRSNLMLTSENKKERIV